MSDDSYLGHLIHLDLLEVGVGVVNLHISQVQSIGWALQAASSTRYAAAGKGSLNV